MCFLEMKSDGQMDNLLILALPTQPHTQFQISSACPVTKALQPNCHEHTEKLLLLKESIIPRVMNDL